MPTDPPGIETAAILRPAVRLSDPQRVGGRSPMTAVLLSVLWPGAGHLYAGRPVTGTAIMLLNAVVLVCAATVTVLVLVPAWVVLLPTVAVGAHAAARPASC